MFRVQGLGFSFSFIPGTTICTSFSQGGQNKCGIIKPRFLFQEEGKNLGKNWFKQP
jgi:hypothetical protein